MIEAPPMDKTQNKHQEENSSLYLKFDSGQLDQHQQLKFSYSKKTFEINIVCIEI